MPAASPPERPFELVSWVFVDEAFGADVLVDACVVVFDGGVDPAEDVLVGRLDVVVMEDVLLGLVSLWLGLLRVLVELETGAEPELVNELVLEDDGGGTIPPRPPPMEIVIGTVNVVVASTPLTLAVTGIVPVNVPAVFEAVVLYVDVAT